MSTPPTFEEWCGALAEELDPMRFVSGGGAMYLCMLLGYGADRWYGAKLRSAMVTRFGAYAHAEHTKTLLTLIREIEAKHNIRIFYSIAQTHYFGNRVRTHPHEPLADMARIL